MITLLLLLIMYGGPAAGLILGWLMIGWKFSLTAAPAAYEVGLKYINAGYKQMYCASHKEVCLVKDGYPSFPHRQTPKQNAYAIGRKCIIRGPFAYFLTPKWNTKLEVSWYPVEVTANKLVVQTGQTLNKAKELESNVRSALDLSDPKEIRAIANMSMTQYKQRREGGSLKDGLTNRWGLF